MGRASESRNVQSSLRSFYFSGPCSFPEFRSRRKSLSSVNNFLSSIAQSSGRTFAVTLAPLPVLAIVPLRSIKDGLLRRDSYASLQTGHQLSTIQIAITKRKLASAQSKKAVFIRKMDFLLWTAIKMLFDAFKSA